MDSKTEVSAYLENISILLLGVFLFILPLAFTTLTTDAFTLPKQVLLIAVGLILMLMSGARMISEGSVRIRRTPFDIPLAIFGAVLLASSFFAINRIDSLIAVIPALFSIIIFFFIINLSKNKPAFTFLLSAYLIGVALTAILSVLSFAKVYILPIPFTKDPAFNTIGSSLDLVMYLVFSLPIIIYLAYQLFQHIQVTYMGRGSKTTHHMVMMSESPVSMGIVGLATLFIVLAIGINFYQMFVTRPILLPFDTGFRTAFAAISQDTGRVIQGFLFGSGYGTYSTDFTRFKDQAFNLNPTLWSFTFFRSSSFVLELLATVGVAGLAAFGFILYKIVMILRKTDMKLKHINPLLISVVIAALSSLVLPFSPITVTLFFILLGLFAAMQRLEATSKSQDYYDVELHFVAFTEGLMPLAATPVTQSDHRVQKDYTKILPVTLFVLFAVFVAVVGFFTYNFAASDVIFQRSIVAASNNNGLQTYTDQVTAIRTFPYRDAYYRIASQTDLALANSLASSIPQGSSPSAQIQQNVTQLIQESISTARTAAQLAPATALNWQNLSSVYRGLIGFGQNAEQFAVSTQQQAIALNPNDPQGYINLGGIFYQIAAWDNAQQAFQTAVNLKPDYPNAYYNLGHALESKGDLQNALLAYQQVEQIVAGDKSATEKITDEINTLKQKINNQGAQAQQAAAAAAQPEAPTQGATLEENKPATQLPEQQNPVKIPDPKVTVSPAPSVSPTPSATTPTTTPSPSPAQ